MRVIIIFISIVQANFAMAEVFLGSWIVDKITTSHISNLTNEEASEFIGYDLLFKHNKAHSGSTV